MKHKVIVLTKGTVRHQRIDILWFHSWEAQGQAQLRYGHSADMVREFRTVVVCVRRGHCKGWKEPPFGNKNVLCLTLDTGYVGVYSCQNS